MEMFQSVTFVFVVSLIRNKQDSIFRHIVDNFQSATIHQFQFQFPHQVYPINQFWSGQEVKGSKVKGQGVKGSLFRVLPRRKRKLLVASVDALQLIRILRIFVRGVGQFCSQTQVRQFCEIEF